MTGKRFARREARAAILEAGLRLMVERGPSLGLERVTFAEAIELSGVPRPSAYRAFADPDSEPQQHFRSELANELVNECTLTRLDSAEAAAASLLEQARQDDITSDELGWLLREVIRIGIAAYQKHTANDPLFLTFVSLLASSRNADSQLSKVLCAAEIRAHEYYISFYRQIFDRFGLQLNQHWTWEAFATAMTSVQSGDFLLGDVAVHQGPLQRPTGRGGQMLPWTLYACLVEALWMSASEPNPLMVVAANPITWKS